MKVTEIMRAIKRSIAEPKRIAAARKYQYEDLLVNVPLWCIQDAAIVPRHWLSANLTSGK